MWFKWFSYPRRLVSGSVNRQQNIVFAYFFIRGWFEIRDFRYDFFVTWDGVLLIQPMLALVCTCWCWVELVQNLIWKFHHKFSHVVLCIVRTPLLFIGGWDLKNHRRRGARDFLVKMRGNPCRGVPHRRGVSTAFY